MTERESDVFLCRGVAGQVSPAFDFPDFLQTNGGVEGEGRGAVEIRNNNQFASAVTLAFASDNLREIKS